MVEYFVCRILSGDKKLEEVPFLWREKVKKEVDKNR